MASALKDERYSSRKPSKDLLRRLSNKIKTFCKCTQLANILSVDEGLVTLKKEETKDAHEIALTVLIHWWKGDKASCSALYRALDRDAFKDLARDFKNELAPSGACGDQAKESSDLAEQSSIGQADFEELADCQSNGHCTPDQANEKQYTPVEWGKTMLPVGGEQQHVAELRKNFEGQLVKLIKDNELLTKENQNLKQQLKECEQEKAALEEKRLSDLSAAESREQDLAETNTVYQQELQMLSDQIHVLLELKEDLEKKLEDKQNEIQELRNQIQKLQERDEDQDRKIQELQNETSQLTIAVREISARLKEDDEVSKFPRSGPFTSIISVRDSADHHSNAQQLDPVAAQPGSHTQRDMGDYISISDYAKEVEHKIVDRITSAEVWPNAQESFVTTLPEVHLTTVFSVIDKIGDENHSAVCMKKDLVKSTHPSLAFYIREARDHGTNKLLCKDNFEKDVHDKILELKDDLRGEQLAAGLHACWVLERWYVRRKEYCHS